MIGVENEPRTLPLGWPPSVKLTSSDALPSACSRLGCLVMYRITPPSEVAP